MLMLQPQDATDERSAREMERFTVERMAGQGTFGTVQIGREKATGATVAIKRVIQDPRFRNRELQIMQELTMLHQPNLVQLLSYFYTRGERQRSDIYLNVVMDYVPETLHRCCRNYYRRSSAPPPLLIKLFLFQLLRSIACLHLPSVNICHRDIKPHNVLVNEATGVLKLCDFGSAKKLSPTEPNVAYICSRYYRAPELIFGNQHYTTAVDVWSVGCIFAEMMLGEPIFRGENSAGQLHEIVKVLGRPTREELQRLSPLRVDVTLPNAGPTAWDEVFQRPQPKEAYDLLTKLLRYSPDDRITAMEALCHPYFDELQSRQTTLPQGKSLPPDLYRFIPKEVEGMTEAQRKKLLFATR